MIRLLITLLFAVIFGLVTFLPDAHALRTAITVVGADGTVYTLFTTGQTVDPTRTDNLETHPQQYFLDFALEESVTADLTTTLGIPPNEPTPLVLTDNGIQETYLVQVFSENPNVLNVGAATAVPEPSSMFLLGVGLLGVVAWRRVKSQQVTSTNRLA